MAVSIGELAVALRLTDGSEPVEPQLSILNRLMGVAEAHVTLLAPNAPVAVRDEATIRMAAYMFDSPPAPGGDRHANAWRNSGAGALVARWISRRAEPVQ